MLSENAVKEPANESLLRSATKERCQRTLLRSTAKERCQGELFIRMLVSRPTIRRLSSLFKVRHVMGALVMTVTSHNYFVTFKKSRTY